VKGERRLEKGREGGKEQLDHINNDKDEEGNEEE